MAVSLDHKKRALQHLELMSLRKALFICAAHFQGGHSRTGEIVAKALDVSFPIRMDELIEKAESEGFKARELWSWMHRFREQQKEAAS